MKAKIVIELEDEWIEEKKNEKTEIMDAIMDKLYQMGIVACVDLIELE